MILSDNNTPTVLLFDEIVQKLPTFFKILIEPALVQKSTIPHMKALLFSYLETEGWGRGIIMGAPPPLHVKLFAPFFSRGRGGQEGWGLKEVVIIGQSSDNNHAVA